MAAAGWTARVMGITSALTLVMGACASPPVIVTPPGPGVPVISALEIAPARIESGCPIALSIQFEDAGRDVVRAVASWRVRAGRRHHDGTDVLPIAPGQFREKSAGRANVTIVPPHPGNYVYRVQLEDALGHSSNVAEARVFVDIRPFWRARSCQPLDDYQSRDGSATDLRTVSDERLAQGSEGDGHAIDP